MPRTTISALVSVVALLCWGGAAVAQPSLPRVDQVDTEAFPMVEAIVEIPWQIGASPFSEEDFAVRQGDELLEVEVTPLPPEELAIMLALDTSLPEESLQRLQGGVAELLLQAPSDVLIGVVDAGAPPSVVLLPTTSTDEALAAIAGLRSSSARATYDAVRLALEVLAEYEGVRPVLALFTAGPDNASVTDFTALSDELDADPLPVYLVELASDGELSPSSQLLTQSQAGSAQVIASSDEIVGAFDQIVRGVSNQYLLTFTVDPDDVRTPVLTLADDELTLETAIPLGQESVLGASTEAPPEPDASPSPGQPTTFPTTSVPEVAADPSAPPDGQGPLALDADDVLEGPSTGLIIAAALLVTVVALLLVARPRRSRDPGYGDPYRDPEPPTS